MYAEGTSHISVVSERAPHLHCKGGPFWGGGIKSPQKQQPNGDTFDVQKFNQQSVRSHLGLGFQLGGIVERRTAASGKASGGQGGLNSWTGTPRQCRALPARRKRNSRAGMKQFAGSAWGGEGILVPLRSLPLKPLWTPSRPGRRVALLPLLWWHRKARAARGHAGSPEYRNWLR